jgi:hypothetical protein
MENSSHCPRFANVAASWLLLGAGCQNVNTPAAISARVTKQYFSIWPVGTSPQEVGKRVAENFVVRPFGLRIEQQLPCGSHVMSIPKSVPGTVR